MRLVFASIILVAASSAAVASTVTLELPGDEKVERNTVSYTCGGTAVQAEYVNAGDNSLVVLTLGDRTVVAVNVLSGSGARYAGQNYVWWTKGDAADLYDLTKGEDAQPEFSCTAG